MTGKTHLSVGTAAAICVTQPQTLSSLLLCLGTAAIGSVISDIDVTTSDSRTAKQNLHTHLIGHRRSALCRVEMECGNPIPFSKREQHIQTRRKFSAVPWCVHLWKEPAAQVLHAFPARTGDSERYCVWNFPGPYPLFFCSHALSHADLYAQLQKCAYFIPT